MIWPRAAAMPVLRAAAGPPGCSPAQDPHPGIAEGRGIVLVGQLAAAVVDHQALPVAPGLADDRRHRLGHQVGAAGRWARPPRTWARRWTGRPARPAGDSSGPPSAAPPGSVDEDEVVSMGCVHILYLIPGLDGSGGAERAVAALAGPYRDRGVQLDVVTFTGRDGLAAGGRGGRRDGAVGAGRIARRRWHSRSGAWSGRGAPTSCTRRCSTPTWPDGSAVGSVARRWCRAWSTWPTDPSSGPTRR